MKIIIDDIKQTIRIKDLSILITEKPSFKVQPDLKEVVEELDATIFLFK
jgi:hypothetical protein